MLLDNGADVNLVEKNGSTALMLAARYSEIDSNLETVRLLLEKGANVNIATGDGSTALIMAAKYSNIKSFLEITRLLLENGANINFMNADDKIFFNYIPVKYLQECLDIIYQIEHHKLCMKKLIKDLLSYDLVRAV